MQQTLLSTKFNIPTSYQPLVPRPRLAETLALASTHRITLVSAPAGYGKTTLVSSWLRESGVAYTWLSLDESDNDPIQFLEYFLSALHPVVPELRQGLLDLLQGSQAASFQTVMALLINDAAQAKDFFVVLDDFHVLHTPRILDMLGYLIEHLPPVMHIMLLSRTDPALPLSRLRARGQLLEIRAEQLRFTTQEITLFFDQVMGLELNAYDISAIETRTEGWIAGLQLAGLAMQRFQVPQDSSSQAEKDHHHFIAAFTGSHAYIMDYLTEEVLRNQPETIRTFMLKTAILDRMCGPLCEAVIGSDPTEPVDGQAMLETIERNHLFVIPLDAERQWYRYHHLFREVLIRRLEVQFPGLVSTLHQHASGWFEQHGLVHEAVQHAMRAGDTDRTLRLVEQHGCALLMSGELITLTEWLAALESSTATRPWLAMQKAWVLALSGQAELAESAIDAGEMLLSNLKFTNEVRTLRGGFAAVRAYCVNTQGKTDLAAKYAREAIDLLRVGGDFSCALRSLATSLLGDASWGQGKMMEARQAYEEAVQIGQTAGNTHMTMMSNTSLADVYLTQGHIHQAARLYSETLQMANRVDGANSSYAQGAHFGLARVYYLWNRLDEAVLSSERSLQLCQHWGNVSLQTACLALTAQIHWARGDLEKAQEAAAAAEGLIREHALSPFWSTWVKTALARFWLVQGDIEKGHFLIHQVGTLQEEHLKKGVLAVGFHDQDPIPFLLEPVYLVFARLSLAQGDPDTVLTLTERLLIDAKTGERWKVVAELLILRALAFHSKKDTSSALKALDEAITLVRAEQVTRVFLDEGKRMAKLLYQAKAHCVGGEFVESLLSCFDFLVDSDQPIARNSPNNQPIQNLLVEPISPRELEVLRAIAEGCSNQEIADRFFLSPKTVKRHISNIYAKLEAKNRTQAVALARSLKLIE